MYTEVTVTEWVQFHQKSGTLRICLQKAQSKNLLMSLCVQNLMLCVAWLISEYVVSIY